MKSIQRRSRPPGMAVALIGLALLCGCEDKAPKPAPVVRPVKIMVVGDDGTGVVRTFPARVEASQKVEMAFKVSGPLLELPAKEGMRVTEGTLLAKIDPRDFETTLKSVQAQLQQAAAELTALQTGARAEDIRSLEARRDSAEAELAKVTADYQRKRALVEVKAISRAEYDEVVAEWQLAKSRLNVAVQELTKGQVGAREEDILAKEAEIRGLKASVKEADDALKDTDLKAPFDGIVAKRHVENFQTVQADQPILFFQDINKVDVIIDIPETDIYVRKENIAQTKVQFPSFPDREFNVTLKEFSTEADPDTQTYKATLSLDDFEQSADRPLLPGSSGTVYLTLRPITSSDGDTALSIPLTAVANAGGDKPRVWIIDDKMKVHPREVTVGSVAGRDIEITSGLAPKERIVTAGVHALEEGMRVKDLNAPSGK